jgi:hypothetical protein
MWIRHFAIVSAIWSLATGCPTSDKVTGPCTPAESRQFTAPWNELSDDELYAEVLGACGHVFVGFKEAGAVRGVDPYGRNLTSAETVSAMKSFLLERGFTFEWIAIDLPHLSARMPLSRRLVREVRHHPNIDYLEPIYPGTYLGRD